MEYTETPKLRHYKMPKQSCVLIPGSSVGVPDMDCFGDVVRSPMSPDAMPAMQLLHQWGASMWCPALLPRFSLDQPGVHHQPQAICKNDAPGPWSTPDQIHNVKVFMVNTQHQLQILGILSLTTDNHKTAIAPFLVNAQWISLQINSFHSLAAVTSTKLWAASVFA